MARIERAFDAGDLRAVLEATTDFYETMFLSAGKSVAWTIVQSLNARISHLRMATIGSAGREATDRRRCAGSSKRSGAMLRLRKPLASITSTKRRASRWRSRSPDVGEPTVLPERRSLSGARDEHEFILRDDMNG